MIAILEAIFMIELTSAVGIPPGLTDVLSPPPSSASLSPVPRSAFHQPSAIRFEFNSIKETSKLQTAMSLEKKPGKF